MNCKQAPVKKISIIAKFTDVRKAMKPYSTFLLLILCLFLCQCQWLDLHNQPKQQGNILPTSKISQLKIGMSKQQVESLLGTSLIPVVFSPNRIDYAYTFQKGSGSIRKKHLVLHFQQGRLTQIDTDS